MKALVAPRGSDVVLFADRVRSWLAVTPPGAEPALRAVMQPNWRVAVFNLDGRGRGPDRKAYELARFDLARGRPVLLEFARFSDALAARTHLMRSLQA